MSMTRREALAVAVVAGLTPVGAARANDEPLTPEQARQLPGDGKEVVVRFKVEKDFPATTVHEDVILCYDITPGGRRVTRQLFEVVLAPKAREQFARVGVADLSAHFRGRVVTVRGVVAHAQLSGPNIGRNRLTIDSLDQFVSVQ